MLLHFRREHKVGYSENISPLSIPVPQHGSAPLMPNGDALLAPPPRGTNYSIRQPRTFGTPLLDHLNICRDRPQQAFEARAQLIGHLRKFGSSSSPSQDPLHIPSSSVLRQPCRGT